MRRATKTGDLAGRLDTLYHDYNRVDSASDPVHKARPFQDPADQEIAAFCAGALAFGGTVTVGTGTMLLMLSLVPAAIVLMFWPGVEPRTADVLYDRNRPA